MSVAAVDLLSKLLDQTVFAPIVAACRRHDCYIATSTQESVPQLPGRYFHTGVIVGPEGLILRSPKSQAQSAPEEYTKIFGPDSILPVVKTPVGNLACYVEREAEVLEVSRLVAAKGAEIILHVNVEHEGTPWMALKQAIAYQCHLFLVTATTSRFLYADHRPEKWPGGASTIIGPAGQLIAEKGGTQEGHAVAQLDMSAIAEARQRYGRNTRRHGISIRISIAVEGETELPVPEGRTYRARSSRCDRSAPVLSLVPAPSPDESRVRPPGDRRRSGCPTPGISAGSPDRRHRRRH